MGRATKLQPTSRYAKPGYPTRDILSEHPELLRLVPERWRANPLVLGVLTGTLSLLSACRQTESKGNTVSPAAQATRVAPLSSSGSGLADYGGLVAHSLGALTEEDARLIIQDEAKKASITFTDGGPVLDSVAVPVTESEEMLAHPDRPAPRRRPTAQRLPLALDGLDAAHGLAYEYVSVADFLAWQDPDRARSTLEVYATRDAAVRLRQGLQAVPMKETVGVFYDPLPYRAMPGYVPGPTSPAEEGRWEASAHQHSESLLRQQVRDFIAWLKAQGVI